MEIKQFIELKEQSIPHLDNEQKRELIKILKDLLPEKEEQKYSETKVKFINEINKLWL